MINIKLRERLIVGWKEGEQRVLEARWNKEEVCRRVCLLNYRELMTCCIIEGKFVYFFQAFGRCELQRFLLKLQETSRELLDQNCDALGYPLH